MSSGNVHGSQDLNKCLLCKRHRAGNGKWSTAARLLYASAVYVLRAPWKTALRRSQSHVLAGDAARRNPGPITASPFSWNCCRVSGWPMTPGKSEIGEETTAWAETVSCFGPEITACAKALPRRSPATSGVGWHILSFAVALCTLRLVTSGSKLCT